eukprot:764796-Hanusia_phi.AAC.6
MVYIDVSCSLVLQDTPDKTWHLCYFGGLPAEVQKTYDFTAGEEWQGVHRDGTSEIRGVRC